MKKSKLAALPLLLVATGCASAHGARPHAAPSHGEEHAAPAAAHGEHAAPSHAEAVHEDPIATTRPSVSEYTGTVPAGRVQVEGGYSVAREEHESSHSVGEVRVRYGLTPALEGRVDLNSYASGHGHSGLEDAGVGLKARLLAGHGLVPSAAVVASTTVPTGSEGIGSESWQPSAALSLGWALPGHVGLTATGRYTQLREHDERVGEVTAASSLSYALSHALHAHGEYAFSAPAEHLDDRHHHLSGGFGYHLNPDLQLDLWSGTAWIGEERELLFGLGISRRW